MGPNEIETPAEAENVAISPEDTTVDVPSPEPAGTAEPGDNPEQVSEPLSTDEQKAGYLRHEDYTRKTQEIAPFRRLVDELGVDPADEEALFRALADRHGYDLDDGEEEVLPEDLPVEERVAGLEAQLAAEREAAAEQEAREIRLASLDAELSEIEGRIGRAVNDEEIEILQRFASESPDGTVSLAAGWDALEKFATARQREWQASKEAIPAALPDGGSGDRAPDLSTSEGRIARAAEVAAAAMSNPT